MRVVCLPLDSRPPSAVWPVELASWCGDTCVMPRAEEMDRFTRAGDFDAAKNFLEREIEGADACVVSVDRLCFGSLLASREDGVSRAEALCREDTAVTKNREMLNRIFVRKPILVEDHF